MSQQPSAKLFTIQPATIADLEDICNIFCESLRTDALSIALNSKISYEEHLIHVRDAIQAPKFADPAYIWFKAVENSSSKTVGWACMRLAMKKTAPKEPQPKVHVPAGFNQKVFDYLLTELGSSMLPAETYDLEKHLFRSGLHVLPNYQRQGIASRLSKVLNDIADEQGRTTFVRARPAAARFFEWEGWTRIVEKIIPYRTLGVDLDSDTMAALKREPVLR